MQAIQPARLSCTFSNPPMIRMTSSPPSLRLTLIVRDTAGEIGSGGERGEAGGAGGGPRDGPEPGGEALEVDRGRGRHVLQAGPGQPPGASPAPPEGAGAPREGTPDAGPPGGAAARPPPAGR